MTITLQAVLEYLDRLYDKAGDGEVLEEGLTLLEAIGWMDDISYTADLIKARLKEQQNGGK